MEKFTNQATLSYNGITTSSNTVTGKISQAVNISKTSMLPEYRVGDILTYAISIQNSRTTDFTDLTLTDNLGAYTFGTETLVPLTYTGDPVLYYVNGVLQTAPQVTTGPPMEIKDIIVPAGASSLLIYRVRVNSYAPVGTDKKIENTATVNGADLSSAVTVNEIVTSNTEPLLKIIKSLSPVPVIENGQIIYTFTIYNTGTTEAAQVSAASIVDTFDPVLSNISATLNGAAWPQVGNYTYNTASGVFTTNAGKITVPAATAIQNAETGIWTVTPGVTTLTITGSI